MNTPFDFQALGQEEIVYVRPVAVTDLPRDVSDQAGPAISYGLGQGATIVAALWGIYVWKEFAGAPRGTELILNVMLLCYLVGLGMIVAAG